VDIKEALSRAIQAERYGYGFYMMAARSSSDAKGIEVFHILAEEELNHMRFLQGQYESISRTGKPDGGIKMGSRYDLSGGFPIFSDGIKNRIKEAHFEMSALAIGIQLELDAMNFYKSVAENSTDLAIRQFMLELADWESGHYHALLRQNESLKQEYWSDAGFEPF
jgi:rubrerythrin